MIKVKQSSVFDFYHDFKKEFFVEQDENRFGVKSFEMVLILFILSQLAFLFVFKEPLFIGIIFMAIISLLLFQLFKSHHMIIKRDMRMWIKK